MGLRYYQRGNASRVQAELYRVLVNDGFLADVEFVADGCRVDVVVHDEHEVLVAIECKRGRSRSFKEWCELRQGKRYLALGVPVLLCRTTDEIPKTVQQVRRLIVGAEV